MMRWIKTQTRLPADQEQVLVLLKKEINLAVFDSKRKRFIFKDSTEADAPLDQIQWCELLRPETGIYKIP